MYHHRSASHPAPPSSSSSAAPSSSVSTTATSATSAMSRRGHRRSPHRPPSGGFIASHWIPFDIWPRIASHLPSVSDQIAFHSVCVAARDAVRLLHASRLRSVTSTFHATSFTLPQYILSHILSAHPLPPPRRHGLILFLDSDAPAGGVDVAWLQNGRLKRAALGLDSMPASSASNIVVSPDASRIACLVTLASHQSQVGQHHHHQGDANGHNNHNHNNHRVDPLHRLRGWERVSRERGHVVDIVYDPCDDCTVQVIDLIPEKRQDSNEQGEEGEEEAQHSSLQSEIPQALHVSTFSHVFVPEYGFDMVWRHDSEGQLELAFAAMLHSAAGAATYLVRWRGFNPITPASSSSFNPHQHPDNFSRQHNDINSNNNNSRPNFVFMACIDGASTELLHDKRYAMLTQPSTLCTSRIELSSDARSIFFDTVSKFGILRFDQVEDAATARVTRADLSNLPRSHTPAPSSPPRRAKRYDSASISTSASTSTSTPTAAYARRGALRPISANVEADARRETDANTSASVSGDRSGNNDTSNLGSFTAMRVSTMSPDGSLLCSLVSLPGHQNSYVSAGGAGIGMGGERERGGNAPARHIEVRSSASGRLVYRRLVTWPTVPTITEQRRTRKVVPEGRVELDRNRLNDVVQQQQQHQGQRKRYRHKQGQGHRRSQQLPRSASVRGWWRGSSGGALGDRASTSASASASGSRWAMSSSASSSSPPSALRRPMTSLLTSSSLRSASPDSPCSPPPPPSPSASSSARFFSPASSSSPSPSPSPAQPSPPSSYMQQQINCSFSAPVDKSADMARHAVCFSSDSTLLVVWDARVVVVTNPHCNGHHQQRDQQKSEKRMLFSRRLPLVIDARTGRTVQDFGSFAATAYEFAQVAPDALTVYATRAVTKMEIEMKAKENNNNNNNNVRKGSGARMMKAIDAIDTISGCVVKSVVVMAGAVPRPANVALDCAAVSSGGAGVQIEEEAREEGVQVGEGGVECQQQDGEGGVEEEVEGGANVDEEELQRIHHQQQQSQALINFELRGDALHTVSRGWVDAMWQTTRGSVGCGWSGRRRLDEHEVYGDGDEADSSSSAHRGQRHERVVSTGR